MNQENTALKNIHQELQKINQRLDGHDQRFDRNDQRFDMLEERISKESNIVHTSINKIATDLYKKCLADDQKHADLKAMFDTFMHRTNGVERIPALEKKVEGHDLRISNLEKN